MSETRILTLLIVLIMISCTNKKQDNNINNKRIDKIETQKLMIVGKQLQSCKKIINDSVDFKNKVIFIYNGFDCSDCIDMGYNITKKIDSLAKEQIVYIIATSTNIGRDQYKHDYYNFIYFDEHDFIRRELKYIYTPVIIKLDSVGIIEDAYFPNPNRNMKKELLFIKKCAL